MFRIPARLFLPGVPALAGMFWRDMKTYMRPRYQCDFCGKRGGSKGHMAAHERACTMNPNRVCGMCPMIGYGQAQPSLPVMMATLPTAEQQAGDYGSLKDIPPESVAALRAAAGGCPACMMAAIRQRGLKVPTAVGFDFTAECRAVWVIINEAKAAEFEEYVASINPGRC